jgi:nucleoside-diphosphate-sugar epimerase
VVGAGGFIGGHLVQELLREGRPVRAVDIKPVDDWYLADPRADNLVRDCRDLAACREILAGGAAEVFNLACDMGGIGYIESHKAACMLSVLINTHLLMAARECGVGRYFYSSSACVYPAYRQQRPDVTALREQDAYPADAEPGYGWEKLFSEQLCRHFREDFGVDTRVARFHNVYGPHGTWTGGREKAPAAICRKVALAELTGVHEIEIWGSGHQTRSYMYVDDCVRGTLTIARGHYPDPLNLGSSELVSVDQLVSVVEEIAGITVTRRYVPGAVGVAGRNSDNTLIFQEYGWQPGIRLRNGLRETYAWVRDQVRAGLDQPAVLVG